MIGVAEPAIPENARTVVVVCPSWVGDAVMATPVYRAVKAHRPAARVAGVGRANLATLLEGAPGLDEFRTIDMGGVVGPLRAGRAIRRIGADAVLLLPNSFRSGLTARLSGTRVRIGYDRDGRGRLLSHAIPVEEVNRPVSAVESYLKLAGAALGVEASELDPSLLLHVTDEERAAADRLLEGAGWPLVVLNPGANRETKRWPAERFAAAATALRDELGATIAVTGAPGEHGRVREVIEGVGGDRDDAPIDLINRGVDLGSLKAVLARADLLITNDTGPRHIAAAVGTPVAGLFGPTDHRWTTLPGVRERCLLAEPFLPEELVADDRPKMCAIDRIPAADVVAAAIALLNNGRTGP